ncbi:MAG TPA: malto-oligosyltrehalose trehalohydrolase [Thermodesulfobacteriota bacterium]|nr:malto-oligosyltrehalose trehalohydrolase [Deltaproteobacteria bacterium]HOC37646.1 malto-oligosyltrehalose trehalohydrolase [Thermodesulfobacteriota bacterium]
MSLHSAKALKSRRFPIGAEFFPENGVHFRVWAPECKEIAVIFESSEQESSEEQVSYRLESEDNGYWSGLISDAEPGGLYRFMVNESPLLLPDPASRFQPKGPHGPSMIIDPLAFRWTDSSWKGVRIDEGHVIYEIHIGTFTSEGTWVSARQELAALAEAGITVLEIMPVADFPGRFGWGYDGVNIFAPTRLYGFPDDFRCFVDEAHRLGLGVILDVVYNHLGPDGNYLREFSRDYFTSRYRCEWGDAINFDGMNAGPVREYFLANAAYWIREFHLDGLRLDATQQIFDASSPHILAELTGRVRQAAEPRSAYIVGENEPQDVVLIRSTEENGCGIDALWNDDFHHSAMVALTGRADAYYSDYRGTPQEFISALKRGFLYQGQWYVWQKQPRGTPTFNEAPNRFVVFIQNHDQLANSGSGKRCHLLSSPSRTRVLTTLCLLAPQTPMLFQGQEFASSSPFFYFADHNEEIAHLVAAGRATFLSQFRALATPEMQARLPNPGDPMTFVRSKIDHNERYTHAEQYRFHQDLLRLRKEDPVFRTCQLRPGSIDGAVLGPDALVIRYFGNEGDDRLLMANLGRDLSLKPAPEPLLAPPVGAAWKVLWSSEDPRYGGSGSIPCCSVGEWYMQGETAIVLVPERILE